MATAAMLSRDACRDTQRCAAIRPRGHDRWDHGLETRGRAGRTPTPTLEPLTQAVLARRQAWTQAVTAGVVEHAHRAVLAPRPAAGPQGGPRGAARGPQDRPVATRWEPSDAGAPTLTGSAVRWGGLPWRPGWGWRIDAATRRPAGRRPVAPGEPVGDGV